jgi:hypothetical protein
MRVASAVLCTITLALPSLALPQSRGLGTVFEARTPLHGLGSGESLLIRVAETHGDAPPFSVSVLFFNERNASAGERSGLVTPGQPVTFLLDGAGLPRTQYPAVRAVIRLSRRHTALPSDFSIGSEFLGSVGSDVLGRRSPTARVGGFCIGTLSMVGPPVGFPKPRGHCGGNMVGFLSAPQLDAAPAESEQ